MYKVYRVIGIITLSIFSTAVSADNDNLINEKSINSPRTISANLNAPDNIQLININNADEKTLALLKGIGEKKAKAIIAYRHIKGKFVSLEELLEVKGIGEQFLVKNRALLTI